ncbi:MAG: hypothetical protein JNK57_10805 [Planctomycetaceae bacterium]|nr:hypothetical protein [Planctomycetaceae bacterium]
MPIATRCTHCGKAYQVAESTLGKQVKCQACGKAFVVAAPTVGATAAGKTAPRANATTGSANHADSVERARIAKLEAEFGLQPIPPNPNQVFPSTEYQRPRGTPSPLANHVVEDPGFEDISEADYAAHRKAEAQAKHEAALRYAPVDDLDPSSGQSGAGGVVALIIMLVVLALVIVFVLFMAGVF